MTIVQQQIPIKFKLDEHTKVVTIDTQMIEDALTEAVIDSLVDHFGAGVIKSQTFKFDKITVMNNVEVNI